VSQRPAVAPGLVQIAHSSAGVVGDWDEASGRGQVTGAGKRCQITGGEVQGGRTGEHRVVNGRVVAGEVQVGVCGPGQGVAGRACAGAGGPNHIGELAEPFDGDGIGDLLHAGEVFVQHRLAVLDLGGQPTGGDGIPAFGLGQLAGRCDDQPSAGGPHTLTTIFDSHTRY
jgi:hypothetical protein